MQYSFSTVIMAVISSNLIIVFTAVCFCHKDLLVSFGYKMFALLLGIAFLRFALPFQFPFTSNIVLSHNLSRIIASLWHTLFTIGSVRISIWTIFEFVWIIGALVKLAMFIRSQLVFNHWVVWCSINVTDDEHYSRLLDEVCAGASNPFCIFELQGLKVPMLYGIRNPRILIPAGMELQEEDLRYLLSHETAHHFHHDIVIKLGVSLLTVVYWWNPACRVLKEQLDAVLEMRIDDYVTDGTFESKRGYLKCLIRVAEKDSDKDEKYIKIPENSIALFNPKRYNTLTNRFELMSGDPKPYARFLHVSALVFTVTVYLLSYAFIFEARYAAPEENEASVEMLDPYIYMVLTENNTYELYYGGHFVEIIDSLDNFPAGTPVYDNIDEVPSELKDKILDGSND